MNAFEFVCRAMLLCSFEGSVGVGHSLDAVLVVAQVHDGNSRDLPKPGNTESQNVAGYLFLYLLLLSNTLQFILKIHCNMCFLISRI